MYNGSPQASQSLPTASRSISRKGKGRDNGGSQSAMSVILQTKASSTASSNPPYIEDTIDHLRSPTSSETDPLLQRPSVSTCPSSSKSPHDADMWSLKRKQQTKDGVGADESVDPQTGAVVSNHKSKEERAFVRRLDMFLMTFGCLSQIIKYLGSYALFESVTKCLT